MHRRALRAEQIMNYIVVKFLCETCWPVTDVCPTSPQSLIGSGRAEEQCKSEYDISINGDDVQENGNGKQEELFK